MRILMLDNEFPPLGGGTGVVNYQILQELSRHDNVEIDLVTSSRTKTSYEIEQFHPAITIYKVPVDNRNIHHSTAIELIRYFLRGLRQCIRLARQKPYDLSFAFAGVPAGAISYCLKIALGLPYCVSLQGPDVPGFEARYRYLYPFLTPLIRAIWRRAEVVTAISDEHAKLAQKTAPRRNFPIIHNGVDPTIFYPGARGKLPGAINILCVGRLIERKGQRYLIDAFHRVLAARRASARLILVGTGDAEHELRRQAARLGIGEQIDFRGYVSGNDMAEVYRCADIFVLPSENEGMSIALLEAMASGLPVIVTDTGGTRELVRHGSNGLIVTWADSQSLEHALGALLENPELRQTMGQMSRGIAEKFSWESITQEYLDVFHHMIRGIGAVPAPSASGRAPKSAA